MSAHAELRSQLEEAVHRPSATFLRTQRLSRHDSVGLVGRPDLGAANDAGGHVAARDKVLGVLAGTDGEEKLLHFKTGQAIAFEFQQRRLRQAQDPADIELAQRLQRELDSEDEEAVRRRAAREAMGDSDFARILLLQEEEERNNSQHAAEDADAELARILAEEDGHAPSSAPAPTPTAGGGDFSDLSEEELAQLIAAGAMDAPTPAPAPRPPSHRPPPTRTVAAATAPPAAVAPRPWGFTVTAAVFSFAMHPSLTEKESDELDRGDALLLPAEFTRRFDTSSEPVFFEAVNPLLAYRQKYAGLVLNRSAGGEPSIYGPSQLLQSLGVEEGGHIQLTRLHLPRATRLLVSSIVGPQPQSPQATLFETLARTTVVAVGDSLVLHEGAHSFETRVLAVDPESPSEIVSAATLQVCFHQPESAATPVPAVPLALDETKRASATAHGYSYFELRVPHAVLQAAGGVKVSVSALHGDPDVYISQAVREPTLVQHTWSASTSGGELVSIAAAHEAYQPDQPFYIGIIGYEGPADFEITASVGTEADSPAVPDGPPPPGFVQCLNCKAHVPAANRLRHEILCLRSSWSCPVCRLVLPKDQKETHIHCTTCNAPMATKDLAKHNSILHSPIKCKCGVELVLEQLMVHQEFDCPASKTASTDLASSTLTYSSHHPSASPAISSSSSPSHTPSQPQRAPPAVPTQPSRAPPAPPVAAPPVDLGWRKASMLICPYCEETVVGGTAQAESHMRSCPAAAAFL